LHGTENPGGIIVGVLETVGGYWSKEPPKKYKRKSVKSKYLCKSH
jgi:hypothetical protein